MGNCSHEGTAEPVDGNSTFGFGNGLMPVGYNLLPEPVLTKNTKWQQ